MAHPKDMLHCISLSVLIVLSACSEESVGSGSGGPDPETGLRLELVAGGFDTPVQVTSAGAGDSRLFVVEQGGAVRIISGGQVLPEPFIDISPSVSSGGEMGLLSLAFPPDYEDSGLFYLDYTRVEDGATVLARYSVDPADPDDALEGSEDVLLVVAQPQGNHNGGMTAFGPDGYLYVALGDGGGGGDPYGNGQDPSTLLGAILRLDVSSGEYAVPGDNPFTGLEGYLGEIWAWGLRNPWRFSFDRETGDLYIADVGQNDWEEIDFQPAGSAGGENYGWNTMEGFHCYDADTCDTEGLTLPVHEYGHDDGCSVTGGYVYRGAMNPGLLGVYIFGDYCSGVIWGLSRSGEEWNAMELLDTDLDIVSFGEDSSGELYVVHKAGGIYLVREALSLRAACAQEPPK